METDQIIFAIENAIETDMISSGGFRKHVQDILVGEASSGGLKNKELHSELGSADIKRKVR